MDKAGKIIDQLPSEQQKQRSEPSSSHSNKVMAEVWYSLQCARLLPKTELVGGNEYKVWRAYLKDVTDEQLKVGRDNAGDFDGFLTVSAFKKLCVPETRQEGYYNPFQALPAPDQEPTPLSRDEIRSRIAKLREELF